MFKHINHVKACIGVAPTLIQCYNQSELCLNPNARQPWPTSSMPKKASGFCEQMSSGGPRETARRPTLMPGPIFPRTSSGSTSTDSVMAGNNASLSADTAPFRDRLAARNSVARVAVRPAGSRSRGYKMDFPFSPTCILSYAAVIGLTEFTRL